MTVFHLVRHGESTVPDGILSGRAPGYALTPEGAASVERLAEYFAQREVNRIYCSPVERTAETARLLAERLNVEVYTADDLLEVDFGDWTGRWFGSLEGDNAWWRFNEFRSASRIPGGELMLEVQMRVVQWMLRERDALPDESLAVVSHGDVIRAALVYFAGVPLDLMLRFEVRPASVSTLRIDAHSVQILTVNWTA